MIACCCVVASAAGLKCNCYELEFVLEKTWTIAVDTSGGGQYVNLCIVYTGEECKMWDNVH